MVKKKYATRFTASASTIALIATAALPTTALANTDFKDVHSIYTDAVNYVVSEGIANGKNSMEFGTFESILRVDAAVMLAQALKLPINPNARSTFEDVPARAQPFVAALQQNGFVFGKTDRVFDSYSYITRGEVALIFTRAFNLQTGTMMSPFTDATGQYRQAVAAMFNENITTGKTATMFGTFENVTRGEYAIFLYRVAMNEMPDMVNKDALNAAIARVEMKNESMYTPASWEVLKQALDRAKMVRADLNATQSQVDAALQQLIQAENGLTEVTPTPNPNPNPNPPVPVTPAAPNVAADDFTNTLVGATDGMEYSTDNGTNWFDYRVANPPTFNGNVTVQVRVKASGINPAGEITTVTFTTEVPANKDALNAAIEYAQSLNPEGYTEASFEELMESLDQALIINTNQNSTQTEVDASLANLNAAIADLVPIATDMTVDKTALSEAIDAADALVEAYYTEASWNNFETALADAVTVEEDDEATQQEVDQALEELLDAVGSLVPVIVDELGDPSDPVDKMALQDLIDYAQGLSRDNYTEVTFDQLIVALTEANAVNVDEDATQDEVNEAYTDLALAIRELIAVENEGGVDKTALGEAIDAAVAFEEEFYTPESWMDFEMALDTAQSVFDNMDATQTEVNDALSNLNEAISNLVKVVETPADFSLLQAVVDEANALDESLYTPASWESVDEALERALLVLVDDGATQSEIDFATSELRGAIDRLVFNSIEQSRDDLQNVIDSVDELEETEYTSDSWDNLQDAITEGQLVLDDSDATQQELDEATDAIESAIDALVPTGDSSDLQTAVDEAEARNYIESYFTPESWDIYEESLANAQDLLTSGRYSQAEYDAAAEALREAEEGLTYEVITYTFTNRDNPDNFVLTFDTAVQDEAVDIEVVGGTAEVAVEAGGTELVITNANGDNFSFELTAGGKPITTTLTWDGSNWTLTTDPANVFFLTSVGDGVEEEAVISLSLLNDGNLLDVNTSLNDLITNPNLVRISLLPGSGLLAGDRIVIGDRANPLADVTLTDEDIAAGFVDIGINSSLLVDFLNSNEDGTTLPLQTLIERGPVTLVDRVLASLAIPEFISEPVVESLTALGDDLGYVLAGDRALELSIPTLGPDRLEAGDQVYFTIEAENLLFDRSEDTQVYTLTQADIEAGVIEYTFDDGLLSTLLNGLVLGTEVTITPYYSKDGATFEAGASEGAQITTGILGIIIDLLFPV